MAHAQFPVESPGAPLSPRSSDPTTHIRVFVTSTQSQPCCPFKENNKKNMAITAQGHRGF